jgi:antitoxin Phd
LQEAKNKFNQVVDYAYSEGSQIDIRHGKETVVILSLEDYQGLLQPTNSLADFFFTLSVTGSGIRA